ncbi:MAG TPA: hypothetical protein VMX16_19245 [Terriglobia bacterium]|nr:hypothetical protein [Terriglobia bacterium]
MSMPPQPPRPPAPPAPPKSGANIVLIVVLILGIIVVGAIFAVWTGLRLISHNVHVNVSEGWNGKKQVSIQTPAGNVEVRKRAGITEASLGLPIYPGATSVASDDSANVSIGVPGHEHVGLVVSHYETSDPLDKVCDFYHERLSGQVTRFTERDEHGNMVFEVKQNKLQKFVSLREENGKTQISLVRVGETSGAVN